MKCMNKVVNTYFFSFSFFLFTQVLTISVLTQNIINTLTLLHNLITDKRVKIIFDQCVKIK